MNQNLTGPAISFVIEQRSSQKTAPLHFIQLSMCVSHDEHFKKIYLLRKEFLMRRGDLVFQDFTHQFLTFIEGTFLRF